MITGYNIDVQFEGVTYHVQTEDMGIDLKRIITHVFIGGAILCSKKTDYSRHLIHGYDEKKIKELMDEQHRTVVRIIQAGKLDVLRRKIDESDEPDREMFPVPPPPRSQPRRPPWPARAWTTRPWRRKGWPPRPTPSPRRPRSAAPRPRPGPGCRARRKWS